MLTWQRKQETLSKRGPKTIQELEGPPEALMEIKDYKKLQIIVCAARRDYSSTRPTQLPRAPPFCTAVATEIYICTFEILSAA